MSTLKILYDDLRARFKAMGAETPDLDARLIIEARTGAAHAQLIAQPDMPVDAAHVALVEQDALQRLSGAPISRIYGVREFWGRPFMLSPDTLDPRPDSETLIEAALEFYADKPPARILDLGTGTGCLLITLLCEFPEAQGVGVDLSAGAVGAASKNAEALGVMPRTQFLQGSWCAPLQNAQNIPESFDLIISNPPYIANQIIPTLSQEVQNFDPNLALDGGADGLNAYREIFSQIKNWCRDETKILLEIGFDQKESVSRLGNESGFFVASAFCDIGGHDRVLCLVENRALGS